VKNLQTVLIKHLGLHCRKSRYGLQLIASCTQHMWASHHKSHLPGIWLILCDFIVNRHLMLCIFKQFYPSLISGKFFYFCWSWSVCIEVKVVVCSLSCKLVGKRLQYSCLAVDIADGEAFDLGTVFSERKQHLCIKFLYSIALCHILYCDMKFQSHWEGWYRGVLP
jgi:hypothetical protein